jgi:hypothetical protein
MALLFPGRTSDPCGHFQSESRAKPRVRVRGFFKEEPAFRAVFPKGFMRLGNSSSCWEMIFPIGLKRGRVVLAT